MTMIVNIFENNSQLFQGILDAKMSENGQQARVAEKATSTILPLTENSTITDQPKAPEPDIAHVEL